MGAESKFSSYPSFEKDPSKAERHPEMTPRITNDAIVSRALDILLDGSTFNEVSKLYLTTDTPSIHDRETVLNSLDRARSQHKEILSQQKKLG